MLDNLSGVVRVSASILPCEVPGHLAGITINPSHIKREPELSQITCRSGMWAVHGAGNFEEIEQVATGYWLAAYLNGCYAAIDADESSEAPATYEQLSDDAVRVSLPGLSGTASEMMFAPRVERAVRRRLRELRAIRGWGGNSSQGA